MPDELRGIGVGPGLAAGPVARMSPPPSLPAARTVTDPEEEAALALAALKETEVRLRDRASAASGARTLKRMSALPIASVADLARLAPAAS